MSAKPLETKFFFADSPSHEYTNDPYQKLLESTQKANGHAETKF